VGEDSGRKGENNGQALERGAQEPSRIIVADDHPLFRSAISYTLEAQPDLEVVAEASDGREALELCRRLGPELVLMDLGMPVMDGVAATSAIKWESPETLVLILTALDESNSLSECLRAGAEGYILKDAPPERLIDAVRRALGGEHPLDEKLATGLLMSLIDRKIRREEGRSAHASASEGDLRHGGGSRSAPRERGLEAGGERRDQPADLPDALHQREHRKEARTPHRGEAWGSRPRAGGGAGRRTQLAR
jgi:DNA-binding NarL/FixJ family response regulator